MSVLHQQRIRIVFDPGFSDWAIYCPACITGAELPTWPEALSWTFEHLKLHHCRFCIDQQMPAGTDPDMGELFERCPMCAPICADCDGIAVYPALYDTPTEIVEDLATSGLTPIFCDGCHGVVAVVPQDPEVYA